MKEEKTKTHVIESKAFLSKIQNTSASIPCLVLIEGYPLGKKFPLVPPKVILGRGAKADLSMDDKSVSQKHAEVRSEAGSVVILDLGSTNGTYVNDAKISEATQLRDGDQVRIGTTIFKFLPSGTVESAYHDRMRNLAQIDALTQTFNKKHLMDVLTREFERCQKMKLPLSLIMLDVDYFKRLNDQHGHLAGDTVLKTACHLLAEKVLRAEDVFGRYGGEEFMVILAETPLQRACEIAERMRSTIEAHGFEFEKKKLAVTVSLGVSECRRTMVDAQALIREADQALYKAKNSGRNQVCVV